MKDDNLAREIVAAALEYGYDGCAILRLSDLDLALYAERLQARLDRFPEAIAIYRLKDLFLNVKNLYPWAKSLIVCKFWLGRYKYPAKLQDKYGRAFLLSPDTAPECQAHQNKLRFMDWLAQKGLKALGDETNAPAGFAALRPAAVASGLGIFRRNNFFYDQKGSWHKLEGFLIDHECEYVTETEVRPCPEKCRLCLHACPFNRHHNWQQGEDFYALESLVELLQPQNMLAASDETLREKVIPKMEHHLQPDQTETLRICARRALQYEKDNAFR